MKDGQTINDTTQQYDGSADFRFFLVFVMCATPMTLRAETQN